MLSNDVSQKMLVNVGFKEQFGGCSESLYYIDAIYCALVLVGCLGAAIKLQFDECCCGYQDRS